MPARKKAPWKPTPSQQRKWDQTYYGKPIGKKKRVEATSRFRKRKRIQVMKTLLQESNARTKTHSVPKNLVYQYKKMVHRVFAEMKLPEANRNWLSQLFLFKTGLLDGKIHSNQEMAEWSGMAPSTIKTWFNSIEFWLNRELTQSIRIEKAEAK